MRLAVMQAAILIGAFWAAGSLARIVTHRVMQTDAQVHVSAEASALADEFAAGGRPRLAASLQVRSHRTDGVLYRLSGGGQPTIGNLGREPSALGWTYFDGDGAPLSPDPALNQDMWINARRLADGSVLTVAEALGAREKLRAELLSALTWCCVVATAGGLGLSLLAYGGVVRRVDSVADAARAASRGKLDVSAPVRHPLVRDDIDDLAEAFNHMLGQINALMQSVRQVSADIAHDLRTPLTRVRNKVDILLRSRADDAALGRALASVNEDIAEVLRAFDAVLRLAEIETGRGVSQQAVELAEVVSRVAEAYRPDAEDGGRRLDTALEPAQVIGDPELLTHAVANLLDNALRHTPEGARITLSTGVRDGQPFLTVADNGPGVPEAQRAAVLERFYRLEHSRTTTGTGLGLAIVAAIAARHGARLDLLEAEPGLAVRLTFPVPQPALPGPAERRWSAAPSSFSAPELSA
jgi:signal transduction histidine kinase